MTSDTLQTLFETIEQRKQNPKAGSYTVHLFSAGENEILKKIGEEAVEVIIAAKGEGNDRVIYEMADLIYHNLVLLSARNLQWADVAAELAKRMK
jgi:phosphoribosyl-ATP pyrophosphohydrolase